MQDFSALLDEPRPAAAELSAARLTTGERRGPPAYAPVGAARPGLLDTRFVRSELSRLRGHRRHSGAPAHAPGRRGA